MRDYRGATHLVMDIASDVPAQLALSFRERRSRESEGARYNVDFFVPASSKPERREIALSAFHRDDNGPPDPDDKLSLDSIQSLTIVDVSGESAQNKLTIRNLRLAKE